MSDKIHKQAREAARLTHRIAPLIAGQSAEVIAEVVCEMVARFIACHHPDIRAYVRDDVVAAIDDMVPHIVELMIKDGAPDDWRTPTVQ